VLGGIARCFVLVATVTVIHAQEPARPTFEVASVKRSAGDGTAGGVRPQPNGITATDASLLLLLRIAYNVQDYQIVGPDWLAHDRYDIVARAAVPVAGEQVLQQMLQSLLAERFKLVVRREQQPRPAYALAVSEAGSRLRRSQDSSGGGSTTSDIGRWSFTATPMPALARRLSQLLREPVIDVTGLEGTYDFTLQWQQDDSVPGASLFTAVQEQLGLTLERRRMPVDVLVVERVERAPVGN
jgi:uncharacterized protein (TIGR03435 family)